MRTTKINFLLGEERGKGRKLYGNHEIKLLERRKQSSVTIYWAEVK